MSQETINNNTTGTYSLTDDQIKTSALPNSYNQFSSSSINQKSASADDSNREVDPNQTRR